VCIILIFVECVRVIIAVSSVNYSMVVCRVIRDISWFCMCWKMAWMWYVARINNNGDKVSP
jgi:hypothetical protein